MMFWDGGGAHWVFWQAALMWVGILVFWALVIWAIYALVTSMNRRPGGSGNGEDPRRILDERLARGEIQPEEYQRLRALLSGRDAPSGATNTTEDRTAA